MKVSRLILTTLLAAFCGGCALIDSLGAPQKTPTTDDAVARAAQALVDWVRAQATNVSNRRINYTVGQLDYRGDDSHVRLLATALRNESPRFVAAQAMVAQLLADPIFRRVLAEIPVTVATDAEVAALNHGDLDGAYFDGRILLRRSKVDPAIATDPRPPKVLLAHEYLHAFGFGQDDRPAAIGAANGGRWGTSTIVLPAALRGLTNGEAINDLAAVLVLLSADYADGLPGDDPRPSSVAWSTLSDDDFGGTRGLGQPRRAIVLERWSNASAGFLWLNVQENGIFPIAGFDNWVKLVSSGSFGNFRVDADLVFPAVPELPSSMGQPYTISYLESSLNGFNFSIGRYRDATSRGLAILAGAPGGPFARSVIPESVNADQTLPVRLQITALDRNLTIRVGGEVRAVGQIAATPAPISFRLVGMQFDRLRLDTTVDTSQPLPPQPGTPSTASWLPVGDDDFGGAAGNGAAQQQVVLAKWRNPTGDNPTNDPLYATYQQSGYLIPKPITTSSTYDLVSKDEVPGMRLTFDMSFPPLTEEPEGTTRSGFFVGRAQPQAIYNSSYYDYDYYDRKDAIGVARVRWPTRRGIVISAQRCNAFIPESVAATASLNARVVIASVRNEVTVTVDGVLRCFYYSLHGTYEGSPYLTGFQSFIDRLRFERIGE